MFDLYCHHCDQRFVVGARAIRSLHRTSEGIVAYARCPNEHTVMRRFADARNARPTTHRSASRPGRTHDTVHPSHDSRSNQPNRPVAPTAPTPLQLNEGALR